MAYEHTVFLSYSRRLEVADDGRQEMGAAGEWVHDVLHPHLVRWLPEFLPGATVAFDGGLDQGARSEPHLKRLHGRSRCMLAVWSAAYFLSDWCRSEWHSMRRREPDGVELTIPIVFAGLEYFDPEAKTRCRSRDVHRMAPFTTLGRECKKNADYPKFKKEIRRLCGVIRDCANRAPAWRKDFPWETVEGLAPSPIPLATHRS